MTKQYAQKTQPVGRPEPQAYLTWDAGDDKGKALAFASVNRGLRQAEPVVRAKGDSFLNNGRVPNLTVRDGSHRDGHRSDYGQYFLESQFPERMRRIIFACMKAYEEVGIVKNVIDLMADFAAKGVQINHPNERIEKFFQEWFRRVNGVERTERFLNLLYRTGNVIVRRQTAKLKDRHEQDLRRASAADRDPDDTALVVKKREVPWAYTFLNPLFVSVFGDYLIPFIGPEAFAFTLNVPGNLGKRLGNPGAKDQELLRSLPPDIRTALAQGGGQIALGREKHDGYYYKRDDWEIWAFPMIHSILPDLELLQKMKLADLSALDGAISCIRVWKLGNIEQRILPSDTTILRLAEYLNANVGGGVMDLVWGPDIELAETSTEVHRFLGESKYAAPLKNIMQGLGIPSALTGDGQGTGFTNNFISLKTLTERLEYGRNVVKAFWEKEIRIVQKAMAFRFPATVSFDSLLTDEVAEKALLVQLADRDLISVQTLQDRFGLDPAIEAVRTRREQRRRESGMIPAKASPFHNPQHLDALEKIYAQSGAYAPSQFGVELRDKTPGELHPLATQEKFAPKTNPADDRPGGQPGQGRPKNKKDSEKRKQKVVKPRTHAAFVQACGAAEDAQAAIARLTAPAYLKAVGKKTLRELTDGEAAAFEKFKFALLCQTDLVTPVDDRVVAGLLRTPFAVPPAVTALLRAATARYVADHGREPPVETVRRFQAATHALYRGELEAPDTAGDGLPPVL